MFRKGSYLLICAFAVAVTCDYYSSDMRTKSIQNFLCVTDEDSLVFKRLHRQEQFTDDCQFRIGRVIIRGYPRNQHPWGGTPVMLYAVKHEDTYKVVSCDERCEVRVETYDRLPESTGDLDKVLFFLKSVTGLKSTFTFEPSLCQSRLLGFDPELLRLVACRDSYSGDFESQNYADPHKNDTCKVLKFRILH